MTLESLGRDAEAISTWEEVANLAGQIIQDSKLCSLVLGHLSNQFRRLERHNDAVRTGTLAINTYPGEARTQAERYLNLSLDLQKLRRYKESLDTARTSVTLYQHLAMRDSVTGMGGLTLALSNLSHCLAASGDHSEAIIVWKDSVSMLDSFLNSNPDGTPDVRLIDTYLPALRVHRILSYILENDEECLMVGFTAVKHLRRMLELYPQNADTIMHLVWADFRYAYNLLRVGRLQDGQQYIDQWIDVWSKRLEATSESKIESPRWHAVMINLKANMLDDQGSTKQALLATRKVLDISMTLPITPNQPVEEVIKLMIEEARLRVNLGDSDEALRVAKEALQLTRESNNLKPMVATLGWSLNGVAVTAFSGGHYKDAIEAAQEGCKVSGSENWQSNQDEDNICMRPSLFAILSSAEANLGRFSAALEYALRAVEESLDIREMKSSVSATTAEQSYMETRGNMAEIFLATGNLAQARQICKERSAYFSKRVEKRMGDYRELAPILRMLGILCCSEGHHEEGNTAAKELSRIMKTLGSAFPSLQEEVKIRLRNQAKVPILKVLEDMCQKLDCEHQAEVLSLFEI
jgi:tetratricopeptide (TPR) repeat protein